MPAMNDLARLGQRVAATHGWSAARSFKAYVWSEQDQATIAACASDILKLFPPSTGSENLLTATLAFQLQRRLDAPIHLVAGTLSIDGIAVRSGTLPPDGRSPFAPGTPPWPGHLWIMAGPHVIDAAIFRIANSPDCPPLLARHVHSVFGPDKGLYADRWRHSRRQGLEYDPRYVLGQQDMDTLLGQAYGAMNDGER